MLKDLKVLIAMVFLQKYRRVNKNVSNIGRPEKLIAASNCTSKSRTNLMCVVCYCASQNFSRTNLATLLPTKDLISLLITDPPPNLMSRE